MNPTALVSLLAISFLACQVAVCTAENNPDPSYHGGDPYYGHDDDKPIVDVQIGDDYHDNKPPYEPYPDPYDYNNGYIDKDNVDCGPLPDVKNGKVEIVPDTKKASIATYICDEGFLLYGKRMRVCAYNGKWTGRAPKCIPVDCGRLPRIANGRLILSGTGFRARATYLCKVGFDLVGNRQRKCKEDGEWSGEAPVCEKITCPKLSKPENGDIFVSGNEPSDFAIYSCKYGFYRDGQRRRECQRTGEWSGMEPTCKKLEPVVSEKSSHYIPPYEEEHKDNIPEHPHPVDPNYKVHVDDDYYGDAPHYYHDDYY